MATSHKRRHKRQDMMINVECISYHQSNQLMKFDGVSINISQSGICLLTTEPLINGEGITVENHVMPHPKSATVRWSKELNNVYFSYGLEFVKQQKALHQ